MSADALALGRNVRRWREKRGHSQEELATLLGWDQTRISRIELGHVRLSVDDLYRVAAQLDVRPATLLRGVAA